MVMCCDPRGSTQIEATPGIVEPAAHPVLALRQVPQRLVQRPGFAVILRQEQRTGNRAAPQPAGLVGAAGLQAEQVGHAGSRRLRSWGTPARRSPASSRRRRASAAASRRNARAPRPHTARRRADRAAASRSDRRGIECPRSTTCRARAAVRTAPSSCLPADDRSCRISFVHPPDNACNTNTSSASPTGSARRIAVGDALAVDIDRHVPPHPVLVVEYIRPQPRLCGEHAVEHGAHRVARHGPHRATQVAFQIRRERDARHACAVPTSSA